MSLRKQAAQYQALHTARLIAAARHLAWDVLSERWEKWQRYGIKDSDGRQPLSYRDTHHVAPRVQYPNIIR